MARVDGTPANAQLMQCMEVWGGNREVDSGVIMPGLDAWAYSKPCGDDASGGDVHLVSSCASGRIIRLLVADVSGHGASAASTSATLRQLMRRYINHLDQRRFVAALNAAFAGHAADGRFATAVIATFFGPTRHLSISNAGHPPPLLYRRKQRRWIALVEDHDSAARDDDAADIRDAPLGILNSSSYGQRAVRLDVGDMVLLATDWLIESRDANDRQLGSAGVLKLVQELDAEDAGSFIEALRDAAGRLCADNLSRDDVTLLLFRSNGLAQRLTIGDRVRMAGRIARGVARSIAGRGEPPPLPDLKAANIGGALFNPLNRLWKGGRGT